MKTNASKQVAPKSGKNKKSNKAPANEQVAEAQTAQTVSVAVAPAPAVPVSTKLIGEHLVGNTRDGHIDLIVKRRQLKSESKVALIKRLLMTEGQTKDSIFKAALPLHNGSDKALINTINTVRADLKRALGGLVVAKGWKTDDKEGKIATPAVAKLRTHQVGVSAFCAAVESVPLKPKAEKKAEKKESEAPAAEEQAGESAEA